MKTDDIIEKSIFLIMEYYKNNLRPLFENLGEDVLWIGPAERQQIRGRDNLVKAFSAEKHHLKFTMGDIKAVAISPHASVREVLLHYDIYTHYPSGNTDLHDQRLHLTWRERRAKAGFEKAYRPEIVMIHISNAWKYDTRDKIYPVHYENVPSRPLVHPHPETWVVVKGTDMSIHRIAASHILYIETVKHSSRFLVHTKTGTIMAIGTLRDMEKNYLGIFIRIHASYLVNPSYVEEIRRFFVILSDGTQLPVPEKKYMQVKKHLLEDDIGRS